MSYMIRSAGRLQRSTRNGDGGVYRKEGKKDGVIGEFTVSRWFRRRCRYAACTDDVLISPEPGYLASIGTVYLARVLESEVATGKTRLPHPPIPRQPSPLFIFLHRLPGRFAQRLGRSFPTVVGALFLSRRKNVRDGSAVRAASPSNSIF